MSKIIEYFYIFSKLTTSLVLILVIFIMGYALFNSYKEVDGVAINLESQIESLSNLLIDNKDNVLNLSKKIASTENQIIEIKKTLNQNNKNIDNQRNEEEIKNIVKSIEVLQNQINQIATKLVVNKNDSQIIDVEKKSDQISLLILLILKKYRNGDSVEGEIALLERLVPNKKQIFEKLSVVGSNRFYGIKNLNEEFNLAVNIYINSIFLEKNKSPIVSFLLKFITISPNNITTYQNEKINILMQAKNLMEKENFQKSLELILLLDNKQKFFYKWTKQMKIYLEFNNIMKGIY